MTRVQIPVALAEFDEGGQTLWIHNNKGETVFRFKFVKGITSSEGCVNSCAHADIIVADNLVVCMPAILGRISKSKEKI